MQKIGTQTGIQGTKAQLVELDPDGVIAYSNLLATPGSTFTTPSGGKLVAEGTLSKLVSGHNENASLNIGVRLAALEDAVARGPFG